MPKRKVSSAKAQRWRSPSGGWSTCRPSLLLPRRTPRPGRRWARINHQFKKGKGEQKGKQAEVANQETEEDLPAENGETKNEESPASDEAEEKEAKSDSSHTMSFQWSRLPSGTIQRNVFINYFVNASFSVALETFF
uniref:Uncharacterized protein n=1 Tax=Marmota marmota marmota TaxID=9994 RepID=A0A8C5ZVV0_MARMA